MKGYDFSVFSNVELIGVDLSALDDEQLAVLYRQARYGTVMESWFPLGGRGNTQTLFNDSTISAIASAHGKSSAQVIIRWHLQAGNICIPGSSNEQHIIEDYDVWDFELSADEMARMTALDKNQRFANY